MHPSIQSITVPASEEMLAMDAAEKTVRIMRSDH
jgi:hypothetical protein